jgi:hypothetical protein
MKTKIQSRPCDFFSPHGITPGDVHRKPRSRRIAVAFVILACVANISSASSGGGGGTNFTTTYYEQGKLIRAGEDVEALGPNLMGDSINEYSGSLSFTQTDVDLPGNNALAVAVARHIATGSRQAALTGGLFGDWDLEIPHLHTLVAPRQVGQSGWYGLAADGVTYTEARCSQFQVPPTAKGGTAAGVQFFFSWIWWDGYHLSVPGAGDQTLVSRYP